MVERKTTIRHRVSSARSIFSGILALFVVLQAFSIAGYSVKRLARDADEASFVVSLIRATCAANSAAGDTLPAHDSSHAQCCILCSGRDLDSAPLPYVAQQRETCASLMALNSLLLQPDEPRLEAPVGWASSWSSQAPPIFS